MQPAGYRLQPPPPRCTACGEPEFGYFAPSGAAICRTCFDHGEVALQQGRAKGDLDDRPQVVTRTIKLVLLGAALGIFLVVVWTFWTLSQWSP